MPTLSIDGRQVSVADGTTVIQATEKLGIFVPRYCYHPGLSIAGYAVFGDGAIDPVTRNGVSDKTEYNVTVDYKLTAEFWPEALKSLWLRGRATWIDETIGGTTRTTKDYRVIVNYEWVFGKTAKK